MENFSLFDKLLSILQKPSPILFITSIVFGGLIFLNDTLLKKLFLLDFRNEFGVYIGIIFIISSLLVLTYFFIWLFKKIREKYNVYLQEKLRIKRLLNLNKEQFETIVQMYYRPSQSANLDILQSTVIILQSYEMIGRASTVGVYSMYFSFFLEPWVIEYIDKHLNFTKNLSNGKVPNEFISHPYGVF